MSAPNEKSTVGAVHEPPFNEPRDWTVDFGLWTLDFSGARNGISASAN